jgi:hypothetical protein
MDIPRAEPPNIKTEGDDIHSERSTNDKNFGLGRSLV